MNDAFDTSWTAGVASPLSSQYIRQKRYWRCCVPRRVRLAGVLLTILATTSPAADWPQFRGPERNGVSKEKGLLGDWTQTPPKLLWTASGLGRGYASVSVVGDTLYTTGEDAGKQFVMALTLHSGGEPTLAWKTPIGEPQQDIGYPGSRCTPTVDGARIYATTTNGDIACLERKSGSIAWTKNMAKDFSGRMMSSWGFSESPLVDGARVVVTPGAETASLVALDKNSGKEVWRSRIPDTKGAAYASIVPSDAAGVRQYVTLLGRGLVSVAADDGRLLWTYDRIANGTANIPSPIVHGDDVFAATGYGAGGALLRITRDGRGAKVREVYFLDGKTFQNHHGGMVLLGDYLYAGTGHNNGFPVCLDIKSGKDAWRQPRGPGEGSAAVIYADGRLYFRYQNGRMALIEATPKGYALKGTFDIPDVSDPSWPHPAIADGMLYLREQDKLYCYDCRK